MSSVTISDTLKNEYRNMILTKVVKESIQIEWINSHKDTFPTLLVTEFYSENGNGAIHFATQNVYTELVKLLINEYGADVNIVNKYGNTSLYLALRNGQDTIVKQLIDAGADVNIANKAGNTPLYWASQYGNVRIVKQLIDAGADVNIVNNNGETPLYWALCNGCDTNVKQLIDAGADVNIVNNDEHSYTI